MFNLPLWLKKFGILALLIVGISANMATGLAQDPPADEKEVPTTQGSFNLRTYLVAEDQRIAPVTSYVVRLINFLALTIGSFAFLVIVIGGFMMLASGGAEAQVSKGKDAIKFALIGLVVAFSAYFITAFVQSIFFEYGG